MPSWLKLLEDKPDHPMSSMEEANKLLADLPKDEPLKALEEISWWLASVKETAGFHPELRASIIMLLDETALPFHTQLLQNYLAEAHLQDFNGLRMWQGILTLMRALADAYALCVDEYIQEEKKLPEFKEKMPVMCVRLLRAIAEQIKLALMRYTKIEQSLWQQLYQYYLIAESSQFADTLVFAYSKGAPHSSPQRELLRAVLLHSATPACLTPEQIEASYRIAARLAGFFDFKGAPDTDCPYCLDLNKPAAPIGASAQLQLTPSMRFFGALRAIPKLQEIIMENERSRADPEHRQDKEFTPQGKLTVIKHLQVHWGKDYPHRQHDRRNINTSIEVIHDFKIICKLVTNAELGQATNLSEKEIQTLKEQSTINLLDAEEDKGFEAETWDVLDISLSGIGIKIPKAASDWVKIGVLCGLKAINSELWWVGAIRRLQTDDQGKIHTGIEILAKKPLSVWLRSLGKGTELVSNWETSSGSFKYDYLPAILISDAQNPTSQATILMEPGNYRSGYIYEVLMGEKNNNIKLTGLLAEGEDFEWISFQWLNQQPAQT